MKKVLIIIYSIFIVFLLLYLIWPFGPKSVYDFNALPQSTLSTLSGDTVQVPNLKAYYSNNYRRFVIPYYRNEYQYFTKLPFEPIRINHPPEEAYTYIKDQTQSTYLEEFTYPLRDSIFINGLEPFDETTKEKRYASATKFIESNMEYETKVILRFYPSSISQRLIVWVGISVSMIILYKMTKKVFS